MRTLLALALTLAIVGCQKPASQPDANASANSASWAGPQAAAPVAGEGSLPAGKLDRSRAGTPAPDSAFEDPAGQPARLADFKGKPVLVNLWATWCGPCITEMPTLDALASRDGGKIQILAISQDGRDSRAKVDAFFADRGFRQIKPYLDSKLALMSSLKVDTLPTTILYGSDGKEVWRMIGIEDWQSKDAAKLLAEAK
jgi:thiol-disulfide isomerase/thioredoxin